MDPYSLLGQGIFGAFQGFTGGIAAGVKPTVDRAAARAAQAPPAPPPVPAPPPAPVGPPRVTMQAAHVIHFIPPKKHRVLKWALIGGGGLLAAGGIAWKVLG
jgi:hypothetical protein